jgi:thioredoxin-like negative regulator of GroEL
MDDACPIPQVDEATFTRAVAGATEPVFVHLSERGCRDCPCASGLVTASAWCRGRARWVCLDVRRWPALSSRYGVTDLPTILVFRAGRVVRRIVGQPLPDQLELILRAEGVR